MNDFPERFRITLKLWGYRIGDGVSYRDDLLISWGYKYGNRLTLKEAWAIASEIVNA